MAELPLISSELSITLRTSVPFADSRIAGRR